MRLDFFNKKNDDSYEFLPIISEIEEEPLNPAGRVTFWIIIALILCTALWLYFGKVDVVVTARGKIIPEGEIKIVQPLETGVVKDILIREGDFVKKGQTLIVIDSSVTEPELVAAEKNLNYVRDENNRLNALIENENSNYDNETQHKLQKSLLSDLKLQMNAKKMEILQIDDQISSSKAEKRNYQNLLSINSSKEMRLNNVSDIIAKDEIERVRVENLNYRTNIATLDSKISELIHQKNRQQQELSYLQSNFKTQVLSQLSEKELKEIELESNVEKIKFRNNKQIIVSPVDGHINTLVVHTIGGVVTPAKEILSIVPINTPLSAKVRVQNKDIGFISQGMPVQVKIDTFDFQKYGMIPGVVEKVSKDSIEDPKEGLVYDVFVTPTKHTLSVDGKKEPISTGMSISAEIKVGKRRIIEFFIYPIVKYWSEAISIK